MIIIHGMTDLHRLPRTMAAVVARALRTAPVVVLGGARQTGKSTLAQALEKPGKRSYQTLDDIAVLERAQREPDALLRSADRITLDEAQRVPDLLRAVKRAVDEKRTAGRFLLTGSANLLLMKRVSESLAGRAVHQTLWPLTRRELLGQGTAGTWSELFAAKDKDWLELLSSEMSPREDWRALARRGGYPTPAHELETAAEREMWFAGYARTYLERDLRDLSEVASTVDFRRLMRAACLRIGGLVNQTELARDVGLSQPTVRRHLDLLEISYQLVRVEAFSVNRTKRLIKTPKLYWSDVGLAMHLAGETEARGAHFENLVLCDLLAWKGTEADSPGLLFWRTASGEEVDFVVEWRGELLPIEVKSTKKPRLDDVSALQSFRAEYPKSSRAGLLLHDGTETTWLADGILAVPWWRVF